MALVGLHVREAQHLPQMDRGGSCDAYAVVSVGGKQRFQTEVVFDSYHARSVRVRPSRPHLLTAPDSRNLSCSGSVRVAPE